MTDFNKTRLNANTRAVILQSAIEGTIWKRMEKLLIEEGQLAEEVRQLSFGGKLDDVEKLLVAQEATTKRINKLTGSSTYVATSGLYNDRVNANVNGMSIRLSFVEEPLLKAHDLKSQNLNYRHGSVTKITEAGGYREHIVIHDEDLKARIMANQDARDTLNTEAQSIIPTIIALLRKAQTVGKLLELWPEAKQYLPEDLSVQKAEVGGLPISIDNLNAKLASLAA